MLLNGQFNRVSNLWCYNISRGLRKLRKNPVKHVKAQRCLDIVILGDPNAGKSMLLNSIINAKIAAESQKSHTTRQEILGAFNFNNIQLCFHDTPGFVRSIDAKKKGPDFQNLRSITTSILKPKFNKKNHNIIMDETHEEYEMKMKMKKEKENDEKVIYSSGIDIALLVIDASRPLTERRRSSFAELARLALLGNVTELCVVLNKVDLLSQERKPELLELTHDLVSLINGVKAMVKHNINMKDVKMLNIRDINNEIEVDSNDNNSNNDNNNSSSSEIRSLEEINELLDKEAKNAILDTTTFYTSALQREGLVDMYNYLLSIAPRKEWTLQARSERNHDDMYTKHDNMLLQYDSSSGHGDTLSDAYYDRHDEQLLNAMMDNVDDRLDGSSRSGGRTRLDFDFSASSSSSYSSSPTSTTASINNENNNNNSSSSSSNSNSSSSSSSLEDRVQRPVPVRSALEQISNYNTYDLCEEYLYEAILKSTHEELPFIADPEVLSIKDGAINFNSHEKSSKDAIEVKANIWVDKAAQQRIMIGKQGRTLVAIRKIASEIMRDAFGKPCILNITVKVRKGDEEDY